MPDQPNVLEALQAMQAQQHALQASMLLREALEDSGLPLEQKKAIRKQFTGKVPTAEEIDTAIEEAQAALQESVKPDEQAAPVIDSAKLEVRAREGRWDVIIDGRVVANTATRPEAQKTGNELMAQRKLHINEQVAALREEFETRTQMAECKVLLQDKLRDSGLPDNAVAQLRKQYEGRVFEAKALDDSINALWDLLTPYVGSGVVLPGQEHIHARVVESEFERMCTALDGYWANADLKGVDGKPVRRFQSIRDAYQTMMHKPWDTLRVFQESSRITEGRKYDSHLRYGVQADRYRESTGERLHESMITSSWGQILGDSITRRMLAEYAVPNLQTWRQVVSDVTNVQDFRTQRRLRMGGYGLLPTVAENVSYTPLTSPTDEEATFAIMKRGGLEFVTLEMMANDSNGGTNALRRLPQRLGRAAAWTIYRFVFDFYDGNLAVAYDSDTTAFFTAGHANLQSPAVACDAAGIDAMIQTLKRQAAYGNTTEILGLSPRFLLHPTGLRRSAAQQVDTPNNEAGTTDYGMNTFREFNFVRIQVDYWTSQTRFYITANPADCPTIEVGFFNGAEDPEIFMADQENAEGGAMWNSDRIAWKIRHIYGGTILDHRHAVSSG